MRNQQGKHQQSCQMGIKVGKEEDRQFIEGGIKNGYNKNINTRHYTLHVSI